MKKIKSVCLVGNGTWGKNLARSFSKLDVLHSICDTNELVLDYAQQLYPESEVTTNFKKILENPLITKVAIAAPARQHYSLGKQALLSGKDVYIEKPLCLDSRDADELTVLAKKNNRVLMVGHLLHYHPCIRHLLDGVRSGELGRVQYIVSNRLNLGPIRSEENALWDFAPHDISIILSLCEDRLPDQVRCLGAAHVLDGIADTTLTTLKFDNGVRAHIYASWLNPFKEQKLTVVGTSGIYIFDDTLPWKDKLIIYRNHLHWTEQQIPLCKKKEPEKIFVPEYEPLLAECEHFIKCCEERVAPRTDGKEGLRVLKVLQAAQASLNEDGEAKVPEQHHFFDRSTPPATAQIQQR